MKDVNHIHFIGIAGSAISSIAILMKKKGYKVTGSDEGVYDPAKTELTKHGVEWKEGYDAKRVEDADLVIIGGAPLMKDTENEEFVAAQTLGKQLEGYAYLLREVVIKDESIVVTGAYGKTTVSAIMNWILEVAGENPSYMIGGKPLNFDEGVRSTGSKYSCLEGDEYVATFNYDMEPRFVRYKPKYAILSSTKWDHINVYPTEESYIEAYRKLTKEVTKNSGIMYICSSGENNSEALSEYQGETVFYKLADKDDSQFTEGKLAEKYNNSDLYTADILARENGITEFSVNVNGEDIGEFETDMIGNHNIENNLAAITTAHHLGISIERIQEGVKTFKGVARRLTVKGQTGNGSVVIDDFAHSPIKAKSSVAAVRQSYPDHQIVAIYYPRPSEREDKNVLKWYDRTFDEADYMILPRIFVKKSTPKEERIYGKDYIEVISKTQPNAHYIPRDKDIMKFLQDKDDGNTVFLFMSASGWRGMIKELVVN